MSISIRKNQEILFQILNYYKEIQSFTYNYTKAQFYIDTKAIRAVSNNLMCIGELTTKLDALLKKKYEQIPWNTLKYIRNRLAHYYTTTCTSRIWDIITFQLPGIMKTINQISMDICISKCI